MFKLLRYLKPYSKTILMISLLMLVQLVSELLLPMMMAIITEKGIEGGNTSVVLIYGGIMLGIAVFSVLIAIFQRRLINKVATSYAYDVRSKIFEKTTSLSAEQFNSIGNASLQTRATHDVGWLSEMINWLFRIFTLPILFAGGIIFALMTHTKLTVISLIAVPCILVVLFIISRAVKPLMEVANYHQDKSLLIMRERLTGIRVIRSFQKEEYEDERFEKQVKIMSSNFIRNNSMQGAVFPALSFINNAVILLLLWFGAQFVADSAGLLSTSGIMAVIQYVNIIISSIVGMSWIIVMMPMLSTSAKRINEVLDMESENLDGERKENKLSGYIELSDLSFTFDAKAAEPVLKNINMVFEPGKTAAVLGGTGSGKSTVAKLLLKLYTPTSGSLKFDGIDGNLLSAEYLRDSVAYISQSPLIFKGTLRSNVILGNFDATDEEILAALDTAQLTDFVRSHVEGLDYEINEGGKNLSGGQKQRLSIARALVRRSNIIIFDDSFSALDYVTDLKLRTALNESYKNTTKVIITQRVATALNADRIYVLEKGAVTASGTHEQLLNVSDTYQQLAKLQMNIESNPHGTESNVPAEGGNG